MKFLCDNCKAKYQIGDEKVAGRTVRMKCRRCGHLIQVSASVTESSVARALPQTDPNAPERPKSNRPPPQVAAGVPRTPAKPAEIPAPVPSADPIPLVPRPGFAPPRAAPRAPVPGGAPHTPEPPRAKPPHPGSIVQEDNDDERTMIMQAPPKRLFPTATPSSNDEPPPSSRRGPTALGQMSMRSSQTPPAPRPGVPAAPRPGAGAPRAAPAPRPIGRPGAAAAAAARPALAAVPAPAPEPVQDTAAVSGMASAFTRAVTEPSPPASASARTPSEDWYVGVGGVPLGPVRLSVIREKAAQGAVDGDSLVWREGFDEWQVLKNFPELLDIVSEAQSSRTSSLTGRRSSQVIGGPSIGSHGPALSPTPRPAASPGLAAASADSGLSATPTAASAAAAAAQAGLLGPSIGTPGRDARPPGETTGLPAAVNGGGSVDVLSDPFGSAQANGVGRTSATPAAAGVGLASPLIAPQPSTISDFPPRQRGGLHPMAYAFIAMAAVFGGVSAYVLLTKPPPPPPQIVVVQGPAATAAPVAAASGAPEPTMELNPGDPAQVPGKPGGGGKVAAVDPKASPSAAPQAAPIDTSGFGNQGVSGPSAVGPGGTPGGAAGGQLGAGEIQGVVSQNQPLVKRKCWQPALDGRGKDGPTSAKVQATVVIGPSGNVDSVSASGAEKDFPSLSSCIASKIKGWKFPPSGGSTTVKVPFFFAGQ